MFAGTPPDLRALYAAAATRTDDFIVFEDERWPMPKVLELIDQIGHALVHELGVVNGDRVAIAMRNSPEWIAAFAAITSVGAIAVPMNAWWQTDEMVFALHDSGARVVFADAERLARMQAAEPGALDVEIVTVRDEDVSRTTADGLRVVALEDLLVAGAEMPDVAIDPDDDATILYTSGTTGNPKGAVSTHRAVLSALMAFAARGAVGALREPETPDPDRPQTAFMLCVPLFHVTGLVPVMLGSFVERVEAGDDLQVGPRPGTGAHRAGAGDELRRRAHDELGPPRGAHVRRT